MAPHPGSLSRAVCLKLDEWAPDARVVTQNHSGCVGLLLRRAVPIVNNPVLQKNRCTDLALALSMGVSRESAGPGDVTVAGRIIGVASFAEDPFRAGVGFAESEVVRGNVLLAFWKTLFGDRELVHEREAKVVLFRREIDAQKPAGILFGCFPTNLAAESGFIAGRLEVGHVLEKEEENGFEEMPIFGAAGKESAQGELISFGFIDVNHRQVALAAGCDVEAQSVLRVAS